LISSTNKEDDSEFGLTEDERHRLLEEAEKEIKNIQKNNKEETNAIRSSRSNQHRKDL
jgi:hypothetical protein